MQRELKITWIALTFCLGYLSLAGQTPEFLNKQADGYFGNKQFFKALFIYQQLLQQQPQNQDLILRRAICEFESNHLDSAEYYIKKLLFTSRHDLDLIHFLYGKILMSKKDYVAAAAQLKLSLNYTGIDKKYRSAIIADIKRCGNAITLFSTIEAIHLESAGLEVNSEWDEINPIPSINIDSKFYFNSNRETIGTPGNFSEGYELTFDMYSSNLQNGEWANINALNANLASKKHELLADFNENGQIVYLKQGDKKNSLTFLADTFNLEEQKNKIGVIDIPFLKGTEDINFFTDDVLLFSSDLLGGFGGFDLYYAIRTSTGWSTPSNLGIEINSPFDEISPYLAFDGRTLFFSSNNLNSVGGFDIFIAIFEDKTKKWTLPQNMGTPVNSSEDEKHFRLNKNRLSGLLASNRKSGVGGFDIYFAYFRQVWTPQSERSRPIFFGYYYTDLNSNNPVTKTYYSIEQTQIKLAKPIIYYESEEQLSLPSVTKSLDRIQANLELYPTLNLIVEVFSDQSGNSSQDLLFSMKRAEQIKDYLSYEGIKSSRIIVKGYGANFPIAKEKLDTMSNPAGKSLNKRIEFTYSISDPMLLEQLLIENTAEIVNPLFVDASLTDFRKNEHQLNYKLLVVSAATPATLETYIAYNPVRFFIEKNNSNGRYELMSQGYPDFDSVHAARKATIANGYEDTIVLAYFSNQRLATNLLSKWAEKYPDLIKYIYRSE